MTEAKDLRKGDYIVYNKELLRVVKKEVVAYGTHSHSKTKLFVSDIHGKGERSFNLNHHEQVQDADIRRMEGQVLSKGADTVQIMDSVSYETLDATAKPEIFDGLQDGDSVTFINFNGNVEVIEKR